MNEKVNYTQQTNDVVFTSMQRSDAISTSSRPYLPPECIVHGLMSVPYIVNTFYWLCIILGSEIQYFQKPEMLTDIYKLSIFLDHIISLNFAA